MALQNALDVQAKRQSLLKDLLPVVLAGRICGLYRRKWSHEKIAAKLELPLFYISRFLIFRHLHRNVLPYLICASGKTLYSKICVNVAVILADLKPEFQLEALQAVEARSKLGTIQVSFEVNKRVNLLGQGREKNRNLPPALLHEDSAVNIEHILARIFEVREMYLHELYKVNLS